MSTTTSSCIQRRLRYHKEDIEAGVAAGHTLFEIAAKTGLAEPTVKRYADLLGLQIPRKKPKKTPLESERIEAIVAMRQEGKTLEEVGKVFGITRERVRQICRKHAPDVVVGSKRAIVDCAVCGREFTTAKARPGTFCSHGCWSVERQLRSGWNRDLAEKIVRLRGQGDRWQDVSEKLGFPRVDIFRSQLQRYIPLLFSKSEREHIFPVYERRHEDVCE